MNTPTVHDKNSRKYQQGFTLIELMVVVVIMAVVVSVGVLSLGRINQDLGSSQQAKIESMLKQVQDESAFKQKLFLLVPSEQGLTPYWFVNQQWQAHSEIEPYQWHSGFHREWQINETLTRQQNLPEPGWLFWPSGDVTEGQIKLQLMSEEAGNQPVVIEWNSTLEFLELAE